MAVTNTTFVGLKKQAKSDKAWHTALNDSLDRADRFIGGSGYGDPNLDLVVSAVTVRQEVEAEFLGQRWYRIDANVFYRCVAVGTPPTGRWVREVIRGAIQPVIADVSTIATTYPGWVLANGQTVDLVYSDLTVIESVVTPNLRGRFLVGFDDSLVDTDYDDEGKLGGGPKKFTVTEDNIEEFTVTTSNGSVTHSRDVGAAGDGGNPLIVGAGGYDHTHGVTIGKTGVDLVEIDNRPPFATAAMLFKL